MPLRPVTRERLASTDHYRLQVNADKELIALGYNAMAGYLNQEAMALIRNQMAGVMNNEIEHQLRVLIVSTPPFRAFLLRFLKQYVAPELQGKALALWKKNGLE